MLHSFLNCLGRFWLYVKLFVLMGGTWLVVIISYFTIKSLEFAHVTYVLTGLQGLFIFLIFVFKRETVEYLKTKGSMCLFWLHCRKRKSMDAEGHTHFYSTHPISKWNSPNASETFAFTSLSPSNDSLDRHSPGATE